MAVAAPGRCLACRYTGHALSSPKALLAHAAGLPVSALPLHRPSRWKLLLLLLLVSWRSRTPISCRCCAGEGRLWNQYTKAECGRTTKKNRPEAETVVQMLPEQQLITSHLLGCSTTLVVACMTDNRLGDGKNHLIESTTMNHTAKIGVEYSMDDIGVEYSKDRMKS